MKTDNAQPPSTWTYLKHRHCLHSASLLHVPQEKNLVSATTSGQSKGRGREREGGVSGQGRGGIPNMHLLPFPSQPHLPHLMRNRLSVVNATPVTALTCPARTLVHLAQSGGQADSIAQRRRQLATTTGQNTVYALTFAGLNFRGFRGSAAIRESFIPRKFRTVWQRVSICKTIASQ